MVLSVIIYFYGFTLSLAFTDSTFNSINASLVGISLVCMALINIVVLIITLKYFHAPRLRWWQRLLCSIGATFIAFILLCIGSTVAIALHMPGAQDTLPDSIGAPIIMLYGIAIEFIAFR